MNPQMPNLSQHLKGALIFIAGLILFLHVTNIISIGLDMIILLGSLVLMVYGFVKMDGYRKITRIFRRH